MKPYSTLLAVALYLGMTSATLAAPVPVVNHSFEVDPNAPNEFYFGDPSGWTLIDDNNVISGGAGNDVQGTLHVTGSDYFGGTAPDGDKVAILFIGGDVGGGEVGLGQVLTTNLAPNTHYTLSVQVGDIESGFIETGAFFDLRGFPGYRIELLAGGELLSSLSEGVDAGIGDGNFVERTIEYTTGATHDQLGAALEIRLFNLNLIDPTILDDGLPDVDLEVDFDSVSLDASPVSVPPLLGIFFMSVFALMTTTRKNLYGNSGGE